MMTILGHDDRARRFCDGLARRDFLTIGSLAMGGLSLPDLLHAEERTGIRKSHKAIIMVYLAGGPSHVDTFDMKPEAPVDIRGDLKPISTNITGIQICEVFPRLARMMDKLAIIRSLTGMRDEHSSHMCLSGYSSVESSIKRRPSLGAYLSRLEGPVDKAVPPFVGLASKTQHLPWSNSGEPGYLGLEHAPLKAEGEGMSDMVLSGITLERLRRRQEVLRALDSFRRQSETPTIAQGVDGVQRRAFDVLTSSRLAEAFDLSKEDPKVCERYGDGKPYRYQYDGAPTSNQHMLLARRLVEAGARCVTLSFGRWDSHGQNFDLIRDHGGKLDQALSALIQDLHERGLDKDVSVVVWGEFGRTPKVNSNAGRDHWSQANFCLLAGGGMRTGQVIGSTSRFGEAPAERPVHMQEVFATLYHRLGITENLAVPDSVGRQHHLHEDEYHPIPELI